MSGIIKFGLRSRWSPLNPGITLGEFCEIGDRLYEDLCNVQTVLDPTSSSAIERNISLMTSQDDYQKYKPSGDSLDADAMSRIEVLPREEVTQEHWNRSFQTRLVMWYLTPSDHCGVRITVEAADPRHIQVAAQGTIPQMLKEVDNLKEYSGINYRLTDGVIIPNYQAIARRAQLAARALRR